MEHARFRVASPDVMHEAIDGEVIVINLVSGNYYSLRGSGADVWALIHEPASRAEVVEALASRYDSAQSDLDQAVSSFVDELREEGLVADVADDAPLRADALALLTEDGQKQAFQAPKLEKYTDLQDLVLLDPVHQVTETGWPAPRPVG